jgi:hypothetical protein
MPRIAAGGSVSLFDENAEILERMAARGVDLSLPRSVDFAHVFIDQGLAEAFAEKVERQGYSVSIGETGQESDPWEVIASREMIPSCINITAAEESLHTLASDCYGRSDGWGFFTSN